MNSRTRSNLILLCFFLGCSRTAWADFEPVQLTSNSYTHDLIIEKTAPPPAVSVTTASMEQGVANLGFTWFERGYLPEWPATGLPEAGSVLPSDLSPDHVYQMPASYVGKNGFLIDKVQSNAVIAITAPTNCAVLTFLTSSGVGRNVIGYTVRHTDGLIESGSFTSPNWYSDGDPAWAANGKINVVSFVHSDLNSYNPRLYSVDIKLSDSATAISSIELWWKSGMGHTVIFAVSAASAPGETFAPLTIGGYTDDLVVEANAVKTGFLETNTTATMENGANNSGYTWYEAGYNPLAPASGLPCASSVMTSESDSSHHFTLASDYTLPNAILIDALSPDADLWPVTADRYSALSFLTASSGGATTNVCVVRHANGTLETNSFVSPDWLGGSPAAALTSRGRVNVSSRLIDQQNANAPKLFAVDVPVIVQSSPITKISLSRAGTGATRHAAIFAIAGAPLSTSMPEKAVLSITMEAGGKISFRSSQPGRLQSTPALTENGRVWRDEGSIQQTLTLTRGTGEPTRFYRVEQ